MASVLAVGIATWDVILSVDGYPGEDVEVRALERRFAQGGNASNTLVVLSQLGHRCSLAAVLAAEPGGQPLRQALVRSGIDIGYCCMEPHGVTPTSYILLNRQNGSRTIVHYRDLPEFSYQHFAMVDLTPYDWVHFEARNVGETYTMLKRVRRESPHVRISVEVEKPRRDGEELLFPLADVLLFSRAYVRMHGYREPSVFLREMHARLPGVVLVCSWGEQGAYGVAQDGQTYFAAAYVPNGIVDTRGAGDTFNAGMIDALLRHQDLAEALRWSCQLAGKKCGIEGLENLIP